MIPDGVNICSKRRQVGGTVRPTRTGGTQLYSRRLLPFPRQTVPLVLFQPYPVKNFQITHSPTSILGYVFSDFPTPINSLLLTVQRDVFETGEYPYKVWEFSVQ
ncbi:hypothetical protein KY290_034296 [Solanum tuberosum]|uniref:Uncharacterized protein n=1 Tax=Solanum tuberosum TaxID=4113 RepID=A0ABQ7U3C2_SOLTU|nr:hypothetical protein KY284_033390 [Solanum tuberosum]KAH0741253.1 hypothetical protein KY290_034296 [Solanum tuberosum]